MEYKKVRRRTTEIDRLISKKLVEMRRQKGITQKQLGEHIGVSVQQIQKYEKGINRISSGNLPILAKALGVNLLYFYEGNNELGKYEKIPNPNEDLYLSITQNFVKIKRRSSLEALNVIVQGLVNPKGTRKEKGTEAMRI